LIFPAFRPVPGTAVWEGKGGQDGEGKKVMKKPGEERAS
jgi:hypothetical protein